MYYVIIVFVGQCEVFVCLCFCICFFPPLAAKLIGLQTGVNSLKNVDISVACPLKECRFVDN